MNAETRENDQPEKTPKSSDAEMNAATQSVLEQFAGANVADILRSAFPPSLNSTQQPGPPAVEGVGEHLEEIANDMLVLMRRLRDIEVSQQSLLTRLEQMQEGWSQSAGSIAREVDVLRRDIIGDSRHTAAISTFNELIPLIDRLRTMQQNLDAKQDERMILQLNGVLESLLSCLRRMGCSEFQAQPGTPFDATRMECVGYVTDGVPDQVQAMVRPGFLCGQIVLRPASVKLVTPRRAAAEVSGGEFDE